MVPSMFEATVLGVPPALVSERLNLIAALTTRVESFKATGEPERAAIRLVAREVGMHPMRVKRLVVLYPEA
jgi:hypothetical protein